jgi:Family of unknown function (DUF6193)
MQAAFDDAGHELTALLTWAPGWWDCATMVTDGQRHVNTNLGSQERVFVMGFWERGVRMAGGKAPDLTAAAGATATWQADSRLAALREAWPFVEYGELAEAYERGNPTQAMWEIFRRSRRSRDRALIEAAYAQPALRVLFPFTNLGSLNFSRCTRFPYSWDLPVIDTIPRAWEPPIDPGAEVRFTISWPPNSPYGTGHIADASSAAEAVAIVVAHLPAGCGPAIDGTAEDLDQLPPDST